MPILRRGELLRTEQARLNGAAVRVSGDDGHSTWQGGQPFDVVLAGASTTTPGGTSTDAHHALGPLAGLRVLDFGMYVAAPFAAQVFADLGADVIKIEPPAGDPARRISQFLACNRGKRSLALDLKDPGSRVVLERLVQRSGVVIHNLRDRAAVPLGLDGPALRRLNPDVVVGTVTGYGRHGPWQALPGYDPTAQALSGWEVGCVPAGHPPMYMRNSIMDTHAGCALALGTLVGLYARSDRGGGAFVDTSLLSVATFSDSGTAVDDEDQLLVELPINESQTGVSWDHRLYRAQDDWIAIAALTAAQRLAMLAVLDAADPSDLEARIATRTQADVIQRLRAADVPCERVARDNRASFFATELERKSGLVVRTTGAFGVVEQVGSYWESSFGLAPAPSLPGLGDHTIDVLSELGFSREEISELADSHTVSVPSQRSPSDAVEGAPGRIITSSKQRTGGSAP
jgi:crotonobetainyl-CoA:carnitine CoA-transferase CaiB-like acyl-CoA transferase